VRRGLPAHRLGKRSLCFLTTELDAALAKGSAAR
jgi:hypothetical protein